MKRQSRPRGAKRKAEPDVREPSDELKQDIEFLRLQSDEAEGKETGDADAHRESNSSADDEVSPASSHSPLK